MEGWWDGGEYLSRGCGEHSGFVVLFFVQPYSHSAYIDYGGTLFYPVPVCRPGTKVGLDGSTPAPLRRQIERTCER